MLRNALFLLYLMWPLAAVNCFAQNLVKLPVFTPAEHLLFIDDFTLYNDNFVQHKWHVAQGHMAHDFDSTGRETLNRKNMCYLVQPHHHPMVPVIKSTPHTPKYVTFECDFWLMSSSAKKMVIDFPDKRGYKHTIAIDQNTLYEKWQGALHKGTDIMKPLPKEKQLKIMGVERWHCLAIAISEEYLSIFLDGTRVWGISHDSLSNPTSAYLFDGYLPRSFTISAEGHAGLRHVRFAQSDKIPPPAAISTHVFNALLTTSTFTTHDIHFETGKAMLTSDSYSYLSALASWLKENPAIKLEIGGHTDNEGSDADNLRLSEARAQAVVNYINNAGVGKARLKYKGYGETHPIMSNDTEAGRAANRRVELRKL